MSRKRVYSKSYACQDLVLNCGPFSGVFTFSRRASGKSKDYCKQSLSNNRRLGSMHAFVGEPHPAETGDCFWVLKTRMKYRTEKCLSSVYVSKSASLRTFPSHILSPLRKTSNLPKSPTNEQNNPYWKPVMAQRDQKDSKWDTTTARHWLAEGMSVTCVCLGMISMLYTWSRKDSMNGEELVQMMRKNL